MSASPLDVHAHTDQTESDTNLPEGWVSSPLRGLLIHVLGGQWGFSPDEKKNADLVRVKVIRGTEFRNWQKDKGTTAAVRLIPKSSLPKRKLQLGDLVLEISGGGPDQPVGRTILIDETALQTSELPLICSNFCRQLRLHKMVDSSFVDWSLRFQYALGEFNRFQTETTNIRNLSFDDFAKSVEIRLPPIAEQKRIVTKIKELLILTNASREHLSKVALILKRFRQSVLVAACSGRLTEDWRQICSAIPEPLRSNFFDPEAALDHFAGEIPDSWVLSSIGKLVDKIEAGKNIRCAERPPRPGEKGIVKISAVTWGEFNENESKTLTDDSVFMPERRIKVGDLLISRANTIELVGACVIVRSISRDLMLSDKVLRLQLHPDLKEWVLFLLRSSLGRNQIETLATGNQLSMRNISQENLRRITVPLPPSKETTEIVRRVGALFRLADSIEKRIETSARRADKLTQAILAKAFRGELVPTEAELARREGRDYEPASALIERIRAERDGARSSSTDRSATKSSKSKPRTIISKVGA